MQNALLTKFINKNKRSDIPVFRPGDTIRVHVKIKEGDKERLQAFEGTVIARNNTGMGESITVRKVSFGQGVERIFPVNARVIDHIDVVRTGRVRRAKLYYLRGLKGRPPVCASASNRRGHIMRPEPAGSKFRCEATLERELRARGFRAVAGVDEVGRGSLLDRSSPPR